MRRRTLVAALLAFLLAAGPAAAEHGERPPLRAMFAACESGPTADERFAMITASMPARRGTHRMGMRFDLLHRPLGGRRWTRVLARGFGRWERSDPGKGGFVYTKRVEHLKAAAEYRAVVRFRWYTRTGAVQRTAIRRTSVCRQPDQRPDLEVESLMIEPGPDAGTARYVVAVLNTGRTAAAAFDVGLVTPAHEGTRTVPGLPAGERATATIEAPACAEGDPIAVQVDVRGLVEEADEDDNRLVSPCGPRQGPR